MRLGVDRDINRSIHLLERHMPYSESDHILTHVYNLYADGHGFTEHLLIALQRLQSFTFD